MMVMMMFDENANKTLYLPVCLTAAGGASAIATPLMYHTHQGVVYAASPAGAVNSLPEGFVFNYQTAAPAHMHQTSQGEL